MAVSLQSCDRFGATGLADDLKSLHLEKLDNSADPSMWRDQDFNGIVNLRDGVTGYENEVDILGVYYPYNRGNLEKVSNNAVPTFAFHDDRFSEIRQTPFASLGVPLPSGQGQDESFPYSPIDFPAYNSPLFKQAVHQNRCFPFTSPTELVSKNVLVNLDTVADRQRLNFSCNESYNLYGDAVELGYMHQGMGDFEAGGLQSDWSASMGGSTLLHHFSLQAVSPEPVVAIDMPADNIGMGSQQSRLHIYGLGSPSTAGSYSLGQRDQCSCGSNFSFSFENHNQPTFGEPRHGSCHDLYCSCSIMPDMLSERNKGPRAFRLRKGPMTENSSPSSNGRKSRISWLNNELCNPGDFPTTFKDAKFFVIKSYCEDNVHKSIKYGVWASTANGNKKLDAAYREAQYKPEKCPVFLLFSVNASAQFCGVAEMVGPVDFDKSVDYWLQDKWSGHFPVRWHIIKDVPNSQFRHILLENNENKPVTNSRDTQEVGLEHGLEMLRIFKEYGASCSILDDFYYYEERQIAIQERKAKQLSAPPLARFNHSDTASPPTSYPVKKLSKSFAEALVLKENSR